MLREEITQLMSAYLFLKDNGKWDGRIGQRSRHIQGKSNRAGIASSQIGKRGHMTAIRHNDTHNNCIVGWSQGLHSQRPQRTSVRRLVFLLCAQMTCPKLLDFHVSIMHDLIYIFRTWTKHEVVFQMSTTQAFGFIQMHFFWACSHIFLSPSKTFHHVFCISQASWALAGVKPSARCWGNWLKGEWGT